MNRVIRTPDGRLVPLRPVRLYRVTPPGAQTPVQMAPPARHQAKLSKPARAHGSRADDAPPRIATDAERTDLSCDLAARA